MESDFLLKDTEINRMLMKEINNDAEKKKRVKKKDKKEKTEKVGVSCLVETEGERKSLESDIDAGGDDAGKSGRKACTAKKVRFQLPGEEKDVEKCLVEEDEAAATLDCVSISGMLSRNEEVLEAEKVTSSSGDGDQGTLDKEVEEAVTQECDSISGKVSRNEEVVESGRETSSFGETDLGDGDKDALGKGEGKAVACPAVGNCGDGNEEEEMDLDEEEMVIGGGVNLEKYVHEEAGKVSATVKARSSAKKRKRSRKFGVKGFMSSSESESEDDLNSSPVCSPRASVEVQTLHSFRGSGESVHPSPNVRMGEVRTTREQQSSEWSESENCGGDSNHSSGEGEVSVPAERLLVPGLLGVVLQKMRSCASARPIAEEGSFLGEGTSQVI